jgi:hypothetical protein
MCIFHCLFNLSSLLNFNLCTNVKRRNTGFTSFTPDGALVPEVGNVTKREKLRTVLLHDETDHIP